MEICIQLSLTTTAPVDLHKSAEEETEDPPLLPPPTSRSKKTIFFDLDETLIHAQTEPPARRYDFTVYPIISGRVVPFYVVKRPGADELLRAAARSFEVVVFTAGIKEYANPVIDQLDPSGELVAHRLFRTECKAVGGKYVKDLKAVGRELHRSAIIDDNRDSYMFQPENGVPVTAFLDDMKDRELYRVLEFLELAVRFDDVRVAVARYRGELEGGSGSSSSSGSGSGLIRGSGSRLIKERNEIVCCSN